MSAVVGETLPFDSLSALRKQMQGACPHFARLDDPEAAAWGDFGSAGSLETAPFELPIANFYMTDPISRASETMAKCTQEFINTEDGATGTDG